MTEITHRTVETNGIRIHLAEAGAGPLVLLCHGFPESWYSWRHQLTALADAGYRAVAPDMRGYGQTDRPEEIEKYTLFHLVGDMVGVFSALGDEQGRYRRARLGRAGRLARRALAAGQFPRRRGLERAVPAARVREADERDAADGRGTLLPALLPGAGRRRGRARARSAGHDPSHARFRVVRCAARDRRQALPTGRSGWSREAAGSSPKWPIQRLPSWLTEADIDFYAARVRPDGLSRRPQLVSQHRPQLGAHGARSPGCP